MNEIIINIDPKHIPRLMPFKAVKDIRYYICGIHVSVAPQGGVYLVSTDGHSMALIYDKSGSIVGAESAIVSVTPQLSAAAAEASKGKNQSKLYRFLVRNQRAMVAIPDAEYAELHIQAGRCFVEGKFPDWRKVLPDLTKVAPGMLANGEGMNPIYLARFAKLCTGRYKGVNFWQLDGKGPVVVQMCEIPEMVALIMPMRVQGNAAAFKEFAIPEKADEPTLEPA